MYKLFRITVLKIKITFRLDFTITNPHGHKERVKMGFSLSEMWSGQQ